MRLPSFRGSPSPVASPGSTQAPAPESARSSTERDFLLRVAEEVWRPQRRLRRVVEEAGTDVMRGVDDSVSRLSTILADNGVEIIDHAGERYDEGRRLTVLHVDGEPVDGLPLWIAETVSPTILHDGRVLKEGQVILTTRAAEISPA